MKNTCLFLILFTSLAMNAQTQQSTKVAEKYQVLPFGSIKPLGWLKTQMQKDVAGFVGNLDQIVPELIEDPIYSSGRLHKNSKAKELGNQKKAMPRATNNTNGGTAKPNPIGGTATSETCCYSTTKKALKKWSNT